MRNLPRCETVPVVRLGDVMEGRTGTIRGTLSMRARISCEREKTRGSGAGRIAVL
jgi:hypothetical protein